MGKFDIACKSLLELRKEKLPADLITRCIGLSLDELKILAERTGVALTY